MSQQSHINALIKRHEGRCHYCDCETVRGLPNDTRPNMATKEHIVPKAFGGRNMLENYVLACSRCNNNRGTSLFFCQCDTCGPKISKALTSQKFIDDIFWGIIQHNKPRVYRVSKPIKGGGEQSVWVARFGHHRRHFLNWEEAMHFANTHEGLIINEL